MIDVEHADIDARAAQQMALVLVEMAERRIEVGARDDAAGVGKLGKDGADDGGDFRARRRWLPSW